MNEPLVLLQNAWSRKYADKRWPRESWLRALHASRSGQRLRVAFPDPDAVYYDNLTRLVGESPDSLLPPDIRHIRRLFAMKPPFVVACGRQAGKVAIDMWPGRLIVCPHPAYRVITNALFFRVKTLIQVDAFHRVRLEQGRKTIFLETIP